MPVCQLCNKRCRVQRFDSRLLEGDTFYDYFCPDCSHTTEGTFERHPLSWQTVIHLVLYHLQRTAANANSNNNNSHKRLFFRWKEDICGFIERHWNDLIPQKNPGVSWQNSVSSVLSAHHDVFANGLEEKGETGWWALRQCEPPRLKVTGGGGVTVGAVNSSTMKRVKRAHPNSDHDSDNDEYDADDDDNDGVEIKSEAGSIDLMLDDKDYNNHNNNNNNNDCEAGMNESQTTSNDSVVKSEQIKKQLLSRLLSVDTTLLKQALSKVKEDKQMHEAKARLVTDSSTSNVSSSSGNINKAKISARAPPVENELLRILSRIKNPDYKMRRLRRKLLSRRERRRAGMELFDLDAFIYNYLKDPRPLDPKGNKIISDCEQQQQQDPTSVTTTPSLQITAPYHQNKYLSLRYKIMGISACYPEYPPVDMISPFSGRPLPPFIRRDEDMFLRSKRGRLMHSLNRLFHHPQPQSPPPPNTVDFMHLRREHVPQLNRLLSCYFWPNIDITESADFPDYSIIAVYNRWLIIGAALLDPDGYLSHLFVRPDWCDAGIGACLLHLVLQSAPPRDIRLHCSATNPAMLLYNRFGFKPEAFIVNHYDKYLRMAEQSDECGALSTVLPYSRHAFLMRLRR